MKNLLIPALTIAILGAANVAQGATFLNITGNDASGEAPWSLGVRFTVPASTPAISISDISYFNVVAGNTIRVGLWSTTAANGYGNSLYSTTLSSTGAGGFTSVGAFAPIVLGAGSYTLAASGFSNPNSFGDAAGFPPNSTPVYSATTSATLTGVSDIFSLNTDPTFFNPSNVGFTDANARWKSVNFTYTVVPEPETYAMVAGAALVGFGLWRRRQAK